MEAEAGAAEVAAGVAAAPDEGVENGLACIPTPIPPVTPAPRAANGLVLAEGDCGCEGADGPGAGAAGARAGGGALAGDAGPPDEGAGVVVAEDGTGVVTEVGVGAAGMVGAAQAAEVGAEVEAVGVLAAAAAAGRCRARLWRVARSCSSWRTARRASTEAMRLIWHSK